MRTIFHSCEFQRFHIFYGFTNPRHSSESSKNSDTFGHFGSTDSSTWETQGTTQSNGNSVYSSLRSSGLCIFLLYLGFLTFSVSLTGCSSKNPDSIFNFASSSEEEQEQQKADEKNGGEEDEDEYVTINLLPELPESSSSPNSEDSSKDTSNFEITLSSDSPNASGKPASGQTPVSSAEVSPSADSSTANAPAPVLADIPLNPRKKNVILLIADGAGFGSFYSSADILTGSPTGLPYQSAPWRMTSVATFHKKSFYDPARDWPEFKELHIPFYQKEPAFIPPDSASTATAMMTGIKTRNGRVAIGPNDERLETIAEIFKKMGRRTGAVTSFQIASATMTAAAAHDAERKHGQKMFAEMLLDGNLDVIVGAGHPEFSDDAQPRAPKFGRYGPSQELWTQIRSGSLPPGWVFTDQRADIQKMAAQTPGANSQTTAEPLSVSQSDTLPAQLLAVTQTANSFQCHRKAGSPFLQASPTLAEVSLAALNILSVSPSGKKSNGFFLLIEGGAVDAANDANDLNRCMEEMADFNAAVEAVCAWVEKYSSWEETLVVVTADHDNGAIYGPETGADGLPASAPIYRGKGILPGARYYAQDHTKQLVPLYARGPGAEILDTLTIGTDEKMGAYWNYPGKYMDNTSIFTLMTAGILKE